MSEMKKETEKKTAESRGQGQVEAGQRRSGKGAVRADTMRTGCA